MHFAVERPAGWVSTPRYTRASMLLQISNDATLSSVDGYFYGPGVFNYPCGAEFGNDAME